MRECAFAADAKTFDLWRIESGDLPRRPASPQLVAVLVGTLHPEERLNVDHVPWPEIAQIAL